MLFSGFVFALLASIAYYWIRRRREQFRFFERLGLPFSEPESFLLGDTQWLVQPHRAQERQVARLGNVYGWFIAGANPCITVADRTLANEVMVARFSHFRDRPLCVFGNSAARDLSSARGENWQRCRSVLSPSFTMRKLKQLVPIMQCATEDLLGVVERAAEERKSIEFLRLSQLYTMQVMGESLFAFECKALNDPEGDEFATIVSTIVGSLGNWRMKLDMLSPTLNRLAGSGGMPAFLCPEPRLAEELFKRVRRIARLRRRLQATADTKTPPEANYLSLMLEAADGGRISDAEVEWNAYLFLLAGYETTASTLAALVYCLATHQDVQARVRDELDQCDVEDVEKICMLPYLENVVREAGRLYGPMALVNRHCAEPTTLSNGLTIPAGVAVFIPIWFLAHDPSTFEEPMQFRPERWNDGGDNSWGDLPFGRGPRQCIGLRFAKIEMKLALARLVKRYRLVVDPDGRTDNGQLELVARFAMLQAKNGVWLRAERIQE